MTFRVHFKFSKFIRWLRSKLLFRSIDTAWEGAQNNQGISNILTKEVESNNRRSNWPFIIFFSALVGAPYLTWKMLSSTGEDSNIDEPAQQRQAPWVDGRHERIFTINIRNACLELKF